MGGKVWSDKEEQTFWEVIIPQSPIAADPQDQKLSWESCSEVMQQAMEEEARRVYTGSMLYEHYYQNLKPGPRPKAKKYFDKYVKDCETYRVSELPVEAAKATPSSRQARKPAPKSLPPPQPPTLVTRPSSVPPSIPAPPPSPTSAPPPGHGQGPFRPILPALSNNLERKAFKNRYPTTQEHDPALYAKLALDAFKWGQTTPVSQPSGYRALRPKPPLDRDDGAQAASATSINYGLMPRDPHGVRGYCSNTNSSLKSYDNSSYGSYQSSFDMRNRLPPIQPSEAPPQRTPPSLGASSGSTSESPGGSRVPLTPSTSISDRSDVYRHDHPKRRYEEEEDEDEEDEAPTKRLRSDRRFIRSDAPSAETNER